MAKKKINNLASLVKSICDFGKIKKIEQTKCIVCYCDKRNKSEHFNDEYCIATEMNEGLIAPIMHYDIIKMFKCKYRK